jgi:chromosome segregation ATPase
MSAVPKHLRTFAGMLESVNEAIVILDKVATIEQFESECKARVEALEQKHRDEIAALDARSQAREDIAKKLQAEAAAIIEKAKVDADAIVNGGRLTASGLVVDAERKVAEAGHQIKALVEEIKDATASLHALNDSADKAKKKCEEYEARIAKAKEELRKALGD